ncbi:hypothetical protein FKX85_09195 [Echinicola soli]|uniref:Uncharacterized protein n=1 Tax=Echinicola soli TaxID=2591634 RepID=A0A514CHB0_9BACT|nr:hypothetical protein [Echinicola soli]QDH79196.1 hypothetical protein FKX85_09195 [Echinicola soli]
MKKVSVAQIKRAKLIQLKLKIQDFLSKCHLDKQNCFSAFLEIYLDAVYDKRLSFAKDMNVSPVILRQITHHHREPNEAFI